MMLLIRSTVLMCVFSYFDVFLQKIMHTRKRHQNMFQDLNRKLHHAEKDRESPASDSKVRTIDPDKQTGAWYR